MPSQLQLARERDAQLAADRDAFKRGWIERNRARWWAEPRFMRKLAEQAWVRERKKRWLADLARQGIRPPVGWNPPPQHRYHENLVRQRTRELRAARPGKENLPPPVNTQ